MPRSFAISDIHGCSQTFKMLLEQNVKLDKSDQLYLLGDYIDRGKDSKGVLDYILQLISKNYNVTVLKGNHEDMLLRSISDDTYLNSWIINGGKETLKSFEISRLDELPEVYINFIKSMKHYVLTKDFILVHAGINFNDDHPFEDTEAMLWLRKFSVDKIKSGNRNVIHGHTPISKEKIIEAIAKVELDKKINIDNGCVYQSNPQLSHLCALELNTLKPFFQINID